MMAQRCVTPPGSSTRDQHAEVQGWTHKELERGGNWEVRAYCSSGLSGLPLAFNNGPSVATPCEAGSTVAWLNMLDPVEVRTTGRPRSGHSMLPGGTKVQYDAEGRRIRCQVWRGLKTRLPCTAHAAGHWSCWVVIGQIRTRMFGCFDNFLGAALRNTGAHRATHGCGIRIALQRETQHARGAAFAHAAPAPAGASSLIACSPMALDHTEEGGHGLRNGRGKRGR